jgi:hypothetical protein
MPRMVRDMGKAPQLVQAMTDDSADILIRFPTHDLRAENSIRFKESR